MMIVSVGNMSTTKLLNDSIDEGKLLHTSVHGYLEMLNSFSVMDIFKACNTDVLSL